MLLNDKTPGSVGLKGQGQALEKISNEVGETSPPACILDRREAGK